MTSTSQEPRGTSPPTFRDLVGTFLKISLMGFGGPNAHLALMLDEVVDRRGWLTREHFLHLVGVTNLLPGPNSSEVAIHIGFTQRGWRGALATGLAFLGPTFVLVVFFSILYFRFGRLPQVEGIFWGLKPVVLALILGAGWKLAKVAMDAGSGGSAEESPHSHRPPSILTRALLLLLAFGGCATSLILDRWEVAAMAIGGGLGWLFLGREARRKGPTETGPRSPNRGKLGVLALPVLNGLLPAFATPLGTLFGLMLGSGAVLFGGGYMLVALLEPFVVGAYGWLTPQEFLDGIALTQAVPGPIVTLVAFVGYAVAGIPGAAVATAGIYIPSFAAVLLVAPALERWRRAAGVAAALKGVNAVVAGAILGVGLSLIPSAIGDLWGGLLFFAALVTLVRFKAKALWIVSGGLVAGLIHLFIGS